MTFYARTRRRSGGAALLLLALAPALAADLAGQKPVHVPEDIPARVQPLPSLREQAAEQQEWLELRIGRILPQLMAEYDVRMWILSMREYAEDPVFWSITSPTTFAARRRSIYVFTRRRRRYPGAAGPRRYQTRAGSFTLIAPPGPRPPSPPPNWSATSSGGCCANW